MGEPLKAEAIVKHFACIVSPSIAATPFGQRQVFGTAAVTFAVTLMPAFRTYGNSAPLFLKRSTAMMPTGMTFKPSECLQNNPVEGSNATSHGHMGTIKFPNGGTVPGAINCGVLPGPNADCSAELEGLLEAIAERMAAEFKANPVKFFTQFKQASAMATANALGETAKGWWDTIKGVGGAIKDAAVASYDYVTTTSLSQMGADAAAAYDATVQWTSDAIEYVAEGIDALSELSLEDVKQIFKEWLREVLGELGCDLRDALAQMATDPRPMAEQLGEIDGMATAFALETAGAILADTFVTKGAMSAASKIGRFAGKVGPKLGGLVNKFKNRISLRRAGKIPDHPSKTPDLPDAKKPPPKVEPEKPHDKDAVKKDADGEGMPNCLLCPGKAKPVNTIYGSKLLDGDDDLDFVIDGLLPLRWQRTYASSNATVGWLGQGWSLPIALHLDMESDAVVFVEAQGRRIRFPHIPIGGEFFSYYELITLRRTERNQYEVVNGNGQRFVFALSPKDFSGLADAQAREARQAQQFAQALRQASTSPDSVDADALELSAHNNQPPQADRLVLLGCIDANNNWIRIHYAADGLPQVVDASAGRRIGLVFAPAASDSSAQRLQRVLELLGNPGPDGVFASSRKLVDYRYSEAGDLVAVVDSDDAVVRTFAWQNHIMVEHAQPGGVVSQYDWDQLNPRGRVLQNRVSNGEFFVFRYDESNGRNSVTDATGRTTIYHYDSKNYLTGITDPAGGETRMVRDVYGNLLEQIDPLGRSTRYGYDSRKNLVSVTRVDGSGFRLAYEENSRRLVSVTDPLDRTLNYRYDARGNLVEVTDTAGSVSTFKRDERGLAVVVTDPRGGNSLLSYDRAGRMLERRDCLGQPTRMEYDDHGNLLRVTDALDHVTHYRYEHRNRRDRLCAITHPDGAVERIAYDNLGRVIAYQDPLGQAVRYQLDADGRPLQRQNALGHLLRYQYDVHGRLQVLTNENGAVYRYAWDELDRLVAELGFDGRRQDYAYDAAGQMTESVDGVPSGASWMAREAAGVLRTHFQRDALGRLLEKFSSKPDDAGVPVVSRTRFRYDAAGQIVEARNRHARVELSYTQTGQLARETTHSHGGNVTTVSYEYDGMGNRLATVLPDGRRLQAHVYGSGHVDRIELDGEIVCEFERDRLNRETVRTQGALRSHYDRDAMGRLLLSQVKPQFEATSGEQAAAPWLSGAQLAREYRYDSAGRLTGMADARKGGSHYAYDAADRLVGLRSAERIERFVFDPASNLLDTGTADQSEVLAARREWTDSEWQEFVAQHIASANFNPLLKPEDAAGDPSQWGQAKPNRLLVYQEHRYRYDRWGNCIEKRSGAHEVRKLLWDAEHQLEAAEVVRVVRGVVTSERWTYDTDPFGRRIAKRRLTLSANVQPAAASSPRDTTHFTWDGNRLLQERSGERTAVYLYEPDTFTPLAMIRSEGKARARDDELALPLEMRSLKDRYPEQWAAVEQRRRKLARKLGQVDESAKKGPDAEIFYFHTDHLGTPRELTDAQGQLAWAASYRAWGRVESLETPPQRVRQRIGNTVTESWEERAEPVVQNLRFAGQYFDDETALHYNRFRYYDPDIGRYVSQDPIALLGGSNAYLYAPNPTGWIDPLGLCKQCGLPCSNGTDGEARAIENLRDSGKFKNIWQIQNRSGHGVDIIAERWNGNLVAYEVKTAVSTPGPKSLSVPQQGGATYVNDRLSRAAGANNGWQHMAGTSTQTTAADIQKKLNAGTPLSGGKLDIDCLGGKVNGMRHSKWF